MFASVWRFFAAVITMMSGECMLGSKKLLTFIALRPFDAFVEFLKQFLSLFPESFVACDAFHNLGL